MRHDSRFASLAVAGALLGVALTAPAVRAQDSSATVRTTADSSFTDAQAERGAQVFTRVCLECHARDDMRNPDFKGKWSGQSTFDLFKNISTTMPDNNPGMLARTEYTDVVAYILKLNGVPSGSVELAGDSAVMSAAKMNLPAAASGAGAGYAAVTPRGATRALDRLFAYPHAASNAASNVSSNVFSNVPSNTVPHVRPSRASAGR